MYFHLHFLVSFYRNICFYICRQRKCNFSVVLSGTETAPIFGNGLMWTGRKSFLLRVLAATTKYPLPTQCLLPGTEDLQPPKSSPPLTHFLHASKIDSSDSYTLSLPQTFLWLPVTLDQNGALARAHMTLSDSVSYHCSCFIPLRSPASTSRDLRLLSFCWNNTPAFPHLSPSPFRSALKFILFLEGYSVNILSKRAPQASVSSAVLVSLPNPYSLTTKQPICLFSFVSFCVFLFVYLFGFEESFP